MTAATLELVTKYAEILQGIYDQRTAGDHTFSGVLGDLFREMPPPEYRNHWCEDCQGEVDHR